MSLATLIVGSYEQSEFAAALTGLAQRRRLTFTPTVAAAVETLVAGVTSPRLIVLLQSWPGQWPAADVAALRRAAPLARVAAILGSWCEGETRTGRPLAGAVRLYLGGLTTSAALDAALTEIESSGHPDTAEAEDRLMTRRAWRRDLTGRSVLVAAPSPEFTRLLVTWLLSTGAAVQLHDLRWPRTAQQPVERPDAIVWDCDESLSWAEILHQRDALWALAGPAPLACLYSFPRWQTAAALRDAIAGAVPPLETLAKPCDSAAVVAAVARLIADAATAPRVNRPPVRAPRFLKSPAASLPHGRASKPRG